VTPRGDRGWDNEILAHQGNDLIPMVKVRYEVAE
jgi:hypothetical protein